MPNGNRLTTLGSFFGFFLDFFGVFLGGCGFVDLDAGTCTGGAMGGINGISNAESASTACELLAAAAAASARSLAACCLRIRSSRAEMGGLSKDMPFRVGIFKGEEKSDKEIYL